METKTETNTCGCMTPGDGYGERVVTHSLRCWLHPDRPEVCGCRDLTHEALCPLNPDPYLCETCGEVFDPAEVDRPDYCHRDHCADCGGFCALCVRHAY